MPLVVTRKSHCHAAHAAASVAGPPRTAEKETARGVLASKTAE